MVSSMGWKFVNVIDIMFFYHNRLCLICEFEEPFIVLSIINIS